ncbi:MAG: HAD family hydrolase [Spirochaetaceae bacterium]
MSPIGVFFDFDGVLVDSADYHYRTWSEAFERLCGETIPEYRSRHLSGKASLEVAAVIADLAGMSDRAQELYELRLAVIAESDDVPDVAPGAAAFTEELQRRSIPYAVVSNAPSIYVQSVCRALGYTPERTFGVDDYGGRHKPDPWPYRCAMSQLGFSPRDRESLLVVEDSATGVRSGAAAGIPVLGLSRGLDAEALFDAGARHVVEDLREVESVVSFG